MAWFCLARAASMQIHAQEAAVCPDWASDHQRTTNEVGVNTLALLYFDYDPLNSRPKQPRTSIGNGVSYKRRSGRNAVQASLDVFRDSFEASDGEPGVSRQYSFANGSAVRTEVRIGFEHQFVPGRVRPYAAIDLVGGHERVQLAGDGGGGDFVAPPVGSQSFGYDMSTLRYGTALSIGLSWRFSDHFSCSAESSCWFALMMETDTEDRDRSTIIPDVLRAFSINYHWN